MCGRYTIRLIQPILESFAPLVPNPQLPLFPRYNIAPSQDVPAFRADKTDRTELVALHWGLIPSWAKDPAIGNKMINARCETIAEKAAFKHAFRKRRCLLPADGFYEWKRQGKTKIPHFIKMTDDSPFTFAGLWERSDVDGKPIDSCTIITTSPNEMLADLHDRMPVIIDAANREAWLDTKTAPEKLQSFLKPFPAERMVVYPVSSRVNRPENDDPSLIEPDMHTPSRQTDLFSM